MPKRSLPNQQHVDQLDQSIAAMLAGEDARASASPLLKIAADLRHLPRQSFKARLKSDLERKSFMPTATETAVRVFAAPRLAFKKAGKAMEFYKNAFGAEETFRFEGDFGFGHGEMTIGDSVIMFAEEWPEGGRYSAETWGHSPVIMNIQVPDVDSFVEHAVAAGAKLVSPPADEFYGYRVATLLDPFGYTWAINTVKEEMSLEEMHRRMKDFMPPPNKAEVPPVPKGYRTVTPYIVAENAAGLIDFVKNTFGAEETFRTIGSAGGIHAEVRVGDSMLMIGGGGPGLAWRGKPLPQAFHYYVHDCDATYKRALEHGAESIDEPRDQEYGERSASLKDAAGNYWYVATSTGGGYKPEDVSDVMPYLHPLRAAPVIDFLKRAFGAEEIGRYASPDGVIHHASVKIGDSYIEMGEAQGKYQPFHSMFYLYVPDCDAVYHRALAAGATSISEPKDQTYGDRSGGVKDVFGNQWYIATHVKDMPA